MQQTLASAVASVYMSSSSASTFTSFPKPLTPGAGIGEGVLSGKPPPSLFHPAAAASSQQPHPPTPSTALPRALGYHHSHRHHLHHQPPALHSLYSFVPASLGGGLKGGGDFSLPHPTIPPTAAQLGSPQYDAHVQLHTAVHLRKVAGAAVAELVTAAQVEARDTLAHIALLPSRRGMLRKSRPPQPKKKVSQPPSPPFPSPPCLLPPCPPTTLSSPPTPTHTLPALTTPFSPHTTPPPPSLFPIPPPPPSPPTAAPPQGQPLLLSRVRR